MAPLSDTLSVPLVIEIIDSLSVTSVFHEFQLICIDLDLILACVQGSTSGMHVCVVVRHNENPSTTYLPTKTFAMSFRVTVESTCHIQLCYVFARHFRQLQCQRLGLLHDWR